MDRISISATGFESDFYFNMKYVFSFSLKVYGFHVIAPLSPTLSIEIWKQNISNYKENKHLL